MPLPTAATGPNTNGKKAIVAGARQLTTVVATIIHTANDQAIQIARTGLGFQRVDLVVPRSRVLM